MENFIVEELQRLHETSEDLMKERVEILKVLAEDGWMVTRENETVTEFRRTNAKDITDLAFVKYDEGEWKFKSNAWLNELELCHFSDYVGVRVMVSNL